MKFAKSTDVLVCVVGATCGKLNLGADCAIGRSVAAIRPNPSLVNQETLRFSSRMDASSSVWFPRQCARRDNKGNACGIPMPLPPLVEQERIVKLLDEADELRKLRAQADRRTAFIPPSSTKCSATPMRTRFRLGPRNSWSSDRWKLVTTVPARPKRRRSVLAFRVLRMGNVKTDGSLAPRTT